MVVRVRAHIIGKKNPGEWPGLVVRPLTSRGAGLGQLIK
jgi:hypothetical protein